MNVYHAFHFLRTDGNGRPVMRDGVPLEIGRTYRHAGTVAMCRSSYHASLRAIDALRYAPGAYVTLAECAAPAFGDDKLVCAQRRALWGYDATEVLRQFARECALSVLHLWDPPDVVAEYLHTGNEEIRYAAWSAARNAARNAARDAAWSAALDAAWSAAWAAARNAARNAARDAAWDTALDAAWSAAWAAARDAARNAARGAAWSAAWAAAWAAARDAARAAQNAMLEGMLLSGAAERGLL